MSDRDKRERTFDLAESEHHSMRGHSLRGNRETPGVPSTDGTEGRSVKARGRTTDMYAPGESDGPIRPKKRANKGASAPAESAEERGPTEGNVGQEASRRTQSRGGESNRLAGVRRAARRDKCARLTALLHHVTPALLKESFEQLKREAAPGVDGVTWHEYERGLEGRLEDLHTRVHRGTYRAQPSLRTWIPKADGRQRPLGIATLEDKIVQQAVKTVLEQIYEVDFLGFSYGFRPGRSQHDALDALSVGTQRRKVNWVLDADIRGFFDAIDHEWLQKFLEHRIADRRVLRLIRKWLRAGVSEDGTWSRTTVGTPQGATISPLLANIYLHYVLDLWVNAWRKKHARGDVIVVRYADDFVMGFQHRSEAERCLRELRRRFEQFGLTLHPEKTRLLEFGRFAETNRKSRGQGKPESFDFLGFTHLCARTRRGRFTVKRRSSQKRMRTKLREIKDELKRRRHHSVGAQGAWLRSVVNGWLQYHAVPGNSVALRRFRTAVNRHWLRALRRRSQKARSLTWGRMAPVIKRWIPPARIRHPFPDARFAVTHPR